MVWMVVFVVLMLFWLFGGGYYAYRGDVALRPYAVGNVLIPWLCVLILGLVVFGALSPPPPPSRPSAG